MGEKSEQRDLVAQFEGAVEAAGKLQFENESEDEKGSGPRDSPLPADEESEDESDQQPDPTKCACCGEEARVAKSVYGPECKKAYNNIDKQEAKATNKSGDRWSRWQEIKRQGGANLNAILLAYLHECEESKGSGHKRGQFDVGYHYEELQSVARVETGEKLVYMTMTKWLKIAPDEHGIDIQEAKRMWQKKEKSLPKYKKKKSVSGILLLPMPAETYIVGANSNEHKKGMRLQGQQIKKPTAEKIKKLEQQVGSGHFGFGDSAFGRVGGGDLVNNAQTGGSLVFAPDGDSIFGGGQNFRDAALAPSLHAIMP